MLGESWRLKGNDEKASKWYQMAYDNAYGPEALRAYAFGLKKMGLYEEAKVKFKDTGIEIGSPYEYRKEITACVMSQSWLKEMDKNEWQITLAPFNSPQNDFSPVLFEDNHFLLTSDRLMSTAKAAYKWTGNPYFDILMVAEEGASPQVFDASLHSEYNDATPTFAKDFGEMCFVRSTGALKYDDKYNKIYFCERKDNHWSNPKALSFQKEKVNYVAPAFSADGKVLYFASNDSEGWGGYDIYFVERKEDLENPWGEPKLLSRNINTLGNESFPTVHGDTLYFASDGLPGMGGFDIFKTWRVDNAWAPPQNLKAPLNSSYDDFGIIYKQKVAASKIGDLLSEGYFTSNRQEGGKGGDDIYRFVQKVPPPKPIPIGDNTAEDLMITAYEGGVNFFDNAEIYSKGESERVMGNILHKLNWERSSYLVSSKVFFGDGGRLPNQTGLSRKHVVEGCHAAMKRLRVDYLDLYFCHRPDKSTPMEETVWAMNHLIQQGKVLYWGTSEWSAQEIMEAHVVARENRLIGPVMEQPQYNMFWRDKVEVEYHKIYSTYGLGTTIWSPLLSGVITDKYLDKFPKDTRLSLEGLEWLRERSISPETLEKVRALNDLALSLGTNLPKMAIAWCTKNPNVSTVILGASKVSQLKETLTALDVAPLLTPEVMQQIEGILGNKPAMPPF
ncbi:unnamed protein product [Darwinula stevensoni]|uniref:NADP-dependent oxidoreductase domain-containing protein n=1 Tax=Darwinula stevensoni TaxID=69355 RepID=A0A7R9A0G6_9CRUS|nr:unnamed protein product [Darwinula stevensoni]CAG0885538.1 unnamed protein product [Darwinula stevensoni]